MAINLNKLTSKDSVRIRQEYKSKAVSTWENEVIEDLLIAYAARAYAFQFHYGSGSEKDYRNIDYDKINQMRRSLAMLFESGQLKAEPTWAEDRYTSKKYGKAFTLRWDLQRKKFWINPTEESITK